ncbi:hypothetical protein DWB77_04933 [Streptomyces hundungensis]|uniref:DUF397 domain-containing protein n=1 Tax=Streptomyces hundungensis TaxID=1077946 RepID=A0A387HFY1_9ACTN|nr:DUF397 domain-containing protein [Streptomyces hundungensis]AYG82746.1 hypothetical protein DWB77_04933 [Streptomyces hundungensis]
MKRSEHMIPDASVLPAWRKSSYSGGDSGQCLEVSEVWRKSTYSGESGGDCLEFSDSCATCVPVRDSKNPTGPAVVFGPEAWGAFVGAVKGGALNR